MPSLIQIIWRAFAFRVRRQAPGLAGGRLHTFENLFALCIAIPFTTSAFSTWCRVMFCHPNGVSLGTFSFSPHVNFAHHTLFQRRESACEHLSTNLCRSRRPERNGLRTSFR